MMTHLHNHEKLELSTNEKLVKNPNLLIIRGDFLHYAQNPIRSHSQDCTHTRCLRTHLFMSWHDEGIPKTWTICDVSTRPRTEPCILDCEFWGRDFYAYYQENPRWSWEPDDLWCRSWYNLFRDAPTRTFCPTEEYSIQMFYRNWHWICTGVLSGTRTLHAIRKIPKDSIHILSAKSRR